MNRQQLEMFMSVARHLNFTKAAAEFYTSQPTISRQISLLEEEWGFPLFLRNRKEVRLTPGGVIMLNRAKESLAAIDAGIRENQELEQGKSGELLIGCLETMDTSTFVVPTAAYFNKMNPNIKVGIERRSFSELRDKLDAGTLDIIFTFDFEIQNMNNVLYDKFCSIGAGILYSKNHPVAEKENVHWTDFRDETFILPYPSDSPGRKEDLERILGYACADIMYVPNLESQVLNVRAGNGVALMDTSITQTRDEEHYCFYPFPDKMAPLSIMYAWKQDNLSPALALYIGILFLKEDIDVFYN
ncbi:LysR family transcriptional regulator [Parasporobacterium paucivorans]|uniref:DNA-binding transcriptional regulator, LysR family n=1 Tax=Parasporobacterium paucivorans DSM 15970 TaxID=1122934 RepID=A0A1M6LBN4_9FIRM|nr:LysR family transcriptional regulator [Parasporobacterium paucivorans]SHJ68542.1 DNA-binding transcriptional regulator, LysR family [Parasporobacterium paucivorans DSM 15970]